MIETIADKNTNLYLDGIEEMKGERKQIAVYFQIDKTVNISNLNIPYPGELRTETWKSGNKHRIAANALQCTWAMILPGYLSHSLVEFSPRAGTLPAKRCLSVGRLSES